MAQADPRFASLKLTSVPDSAQVLLDGTLRGTTPLDLDAIRPGKHLLTVIKTGFRRYSKDLAFEGGKRIVGTARMTAFTEVEKDSAHHVDSLKAIVAGIPIPDKNTYIALTKAPTLVRTDNPEYPIEAKESGITGKVYVQMLIEVDGTVLKAEIAKSSGNLMLDDAAIAAAIEWRFTPALAPGDKPVRVWVMQAFTFKLHADD